MAIANIIGKALSKKAGKEASEEVAKRGGEVIGRRAEKFMGKAEEVSPKRLGANATASNEVAKRGGEVMGRKPEKFMGMAEEVTPKRLSGPAAEQAKRGGMGKASAAAAGGAAAAAVGAAALSGRDKEEAPTRMSSGKVQMEEEAPTRSAAKAEEKASPSKAKAAEQTNRVVSKKELEDSGLSLRDFLNKERGLTRREDKGETASKQAEKPTGVREGRNESIDEETRKRAMESVEYRSDPYSKMTQAEKDARVGYAKGGMVRNKGIGASMKPHNLFGKKK